MRFGWSFYHEEHEGHEAGRQFGYWFPIAKFRSEIPYFFFACVAFCGRVSRIRTQSTTKATGSQLTNEANQKRPTRLQRETRLRDVLRVRGEASVAVLADELGVSEMTLRRDLDRLESAGYVRRTHGGAVPAERLGFEFDFVARRQTNQKAKRAIAAAAVKLIKPGHVVLLDAGTTALELACLLRGVPDLVVVTPSLAVAAELQFADGIQTILLGGILRRGNPDLTGEVTEAALEMLAVDIAFQGSDGVGLDGMLYTADLGVARVDRTIRQRAGCTYVLADSSKVGRSALACHGELSEMSGWFTDGGIQPEHLKTLRAYGCPITVVGEGK